MTRSDLQASLLSWPPLLVLDLATQAVSPVCWCIRSALQIDGRGRGPAGEMPGVTRALSQCCSRNNA